MSVSLRMVVPEAPLEETKHGRRPGGEGWFVVNAREVRWRDRGDRGAFCDFEGERRFPEFGINLFVLEPGQPMGIYHWEATRRTSSSSPGLPADRGGGGARAEDVGLRPLAAAGRST